MERREENGRKAKHSLKNNKKNRKNTFFRNLAEHEIKFFSEKKFSIKKKNFFFQKHKRRRKKKKW